MLRFSGLCDDGIAASDACASGDGLAGAFEGFDGEDDAIFDDDGLSDIEVAGGAGDLEAIADVAGFAFAGCALCKDARRGKVSGHEEGGREDGEALFGEQVGDASKGGVGIDGGEAREFGACSIVIASAKEAEGMDLAGHEHGLAVGGASAFEEEG